MIGRLNRESNPVPGERAGFLPQHKNTDGSFLDTGKINPLPTNDDLVYQQLDSLKQLINDQQTLTKKVEVTNQKATQSVDGTVGINNYPTDQKVSDSDVLAKLSELDSKMNGIIDGSTPASSQIVGSSIEEGLRTKNSKKTIVQTLVNAEIVNPGMWNKANIGYTDESDIWFSINIDQQPWSVNTDIHTFNSLEALSTPKGYGVYPPKLNETEIYVNSAYPATMLWLGGVYLHPVFGLEMPTSLADAYASKTGYFKNAGVGVLNSSSEIATLTLKVIRIWR